MAILWQTQYAGLCHPVVLSSFAQRGYSPLLPEPLPTCHDAAIAWLWDMTNLHCMSCSVETRWLCFAALLRVSFRWLVSQGTATCLLLDRFAGIAGKYDNDMRRCLARLRCQQANSSWAAKMPMQCVCSRAWTAPSSWPLLSSLMSCSMTEPSAITNSTSLWHGKGACSQ